MKLGKDPHSFSNFEEVVTRNIIINLNVDFERKILFGSVLLHLEILKDNVENVLLDGRGLAIESTLDEDTNTPLSFTIPKNSNIGFCLQVPVPKTSNTKGTFFNLRIKFNTSEYSGGIQWFEPEQTSGKVYPFMYTQFEAILARTMIPCQDTPSVKSPYEIKVTCKDPLVVACSGVPASEPKKTTSNGVNYITYHFEQKIKIPAYLIALTCGALERAKIGPRSYVWCEKEYLEASKHEFTETEEFLKSGEKICAYPYVWKTYDLMVLPGAFPYGGMENPNLTFISAVLITGDRSLTDVIAHEITHSWSGNLVTNQTWSDFWLNEGFTMYIERLILGDVKGEDLRQFHHILGYTELIKTCNELKDEPEFTKLVPNLDGIDPDDAFSRIPYEKGCLLLLYLESLIGGKDVMVDWIQRYFNDYIEQSINTNHMKSHFTKSFPNVKVDWEHWFFGTGLPNWVPLDYLDQKLNNQCKALSDIWLNKNGEGSSDKDIQWDSTQTMVFLDTLFNTGKLMNLDVLKKMDSIYQFSNSKNVEIAFRWFMLNLSSNNKDIFVSVSKFLAVNGRGVYLKPMYMKLISLAKEGIFEMKDVKDLYQKNRNYYHSVIRNLLDNLLK